MGDILRRSLAPIASEAWEQIDMEAKRILPLYLSGRAVVDVSEPRGWELAAINLGRLAISDEPAWEGVQWGVRSVLPLVEARVPFTLRQMDLDNIVRGSEDADLSPVETAAQRLADFEESVVYQGFESAGYRGIMETSPHRPVTLFSDAERYPESVSEGIKTLEKAGIDGPYSLVLGSEQYHKLTQNVSAGYPPVRIIRDMLGGEVLWSPAVDAGVVVSLRGGDFEMVLGQDLAIGYAYHDKDNVELYLTESFAFRILEPEAAVRLEQ